jgi:hypothetical protein
MNKLSRLASPLLTILLLASPACAVAANATTDQQDLAALKAQVAKLSAKIDQLQAQEKKHNAAAKTVAAAPEKAPAPVAPAAAASVPTPAAVVPVAASEVVTKGTFPGSFHIPGTDTSIKFGGYVKLDAIEDIGSSYGNGYGKFLTIPLKNSVNAQQSSQTTFGAQQSRVNLESRTQTSLGEVRTFIEGDFYGSTAANSNTSGYGIELRHAYGSLGSKETGQILAGQTWSNYMDVAAMPEALDYIGPAGTIFLRQPQVRYTQAFGSVTLSGSVEVPADIGQTGSTAGQNSVDSFSTAAPSATANPAREQMPDLVALAQYDYTSKGYVALRAVTNQINVDRTTAAGNNDTATKYGYGVAVSGKQGVLAKDAVLYHLDLGNGTGRYNYDVGAGGVLYNNVTNALKTTPYYGGTLGYQHYWSSEFRSNVFGGAVRLVNDTNIMNRVTAGSLNKYVASGHANLIWQPSPAYEVGIEYMHGYRKTETGIEGNLNRTEASFLYNF